MATTLNDAHMQKRIARTVGQLHKAKAFVRVVPFDDGLDGRAGGTIELGTARRRVSEIAGRRLIVIVGEITSAGW